jgi:hypothetical protein
MQSAETFCAHATGRPRRMSMIQLFTKRIALALQFHQKRPE